MSDDVEHTPAPWTLTRTHSGAGDLVVEGAEGFVATPWLMPDSEDEMLANACLIAAAPELLEAAKQLLQAISAEAGTCAEVSPPVREQICSDARDAIAKAEGRDE
jgi:hypothetical protein